MARPKRPYPRDVESFDDALVCVVDFFRTAEVTFTRKWGPKRKEWDKLNEAITRLWRYHVHKR